MELPAHIDTDTAWSILWVLSLGSLVICMACIYWFAGRWYGPPNHRNHILLLPAASAFL